MARAKGSGRTLRDARGGYWPFCRVRFPRHVANCVGRRSHQTHPDLRIQEAAMADAVVIDVVRTPLGKRGGRLAGWHPVDLAAHTLRALVDRTGIDPVVIDDV